MQELFHTQKYIHVPNLLDLESCQEHVKAFKALIDQGDTFQDQQCPLSHSVGHCALFDNLLDELTPAMEKITGLSLFPTYAYARWYAPGDELKIHRDRPACEISATINLGFEGNQWPIYVGHEFNKQDARKIDMNIGDAVIYKGCELFHWREKYVEGQWQAQVFIHYVDQNGPNAEWKYDKRKELEHHAILKENSIKLEKGKEFRKNLLSFLENNKKDLKKETDNPDNGRFLVAKEAFSKEGCQRIINKFESNQDNLIPALLIGDQLDLSIRDTKKIIQNNSIGLGATLTGIGLAANKNSWNFHITNSNQSEYLRYDENGHFATHIDTILQEYGSDQCRKLTVILILNDDFEGGQLYLEIAKEKIYPSQNPGDVIIFPSFLAHGVEPVKSGIRRSVVTWLVGPYFK